jgi:hypothetical protein
MSKLLAAAILLAFAAVAGAGENRSIVRVKDVDRAQRPLLGHRFGHLPLDRKRGEFVLEVDAADWQWLRAHGFEARVDAVLTAQLRAMLAKSIPGYACYHTVEETDAFIDAQVAAHPTLASVVDIGDSWDKLTPMGATGYDLRVLRLTSSAIVADKPKMFVMSGLHAREYTPVQVNLKFAEGLLAGYGSDPEATWLLDHHEFHLLLQANPDGRKIAEGGQSQRKNRHYQNQCSGTGIGTDLNRNFPWLWNSIPGDGGSSSFPCDLDYRGQSAGSEPETQAIDAYVTALFPDTRTGAETSLTDPAAVDTRGLYLDVHSAGELVLWPWGMTDTQTAPNAAALQALGRRFAWFNSYYPQQSSELYPTDGASDDAAYGKRGVPAYTFELGTTFFQNCNTFNTTILPANLAALRYGARVLERPYQWPSGPDLHDLTATPAAVTAGTPVVIGATASDGRFAQSNGVEPVQAIASALASVDLPPWDPLAVLLPVAAADGQFDASSEALQLQLDTSTLGAGRHLVYLQATDANGDLGAPAAVFVEVLVNLFADGFE